MRNYHQLTFVPLRRGAISYGMCSLNPAIQALGSCCICSMGVLSDLPALPGIQLFLLLIFAELGVPGREGDCGTPAGATYTGVCGRLLLPSLLFNIGLWALLPGLLP